jgi:hypothetical protein
VAERQGLVVQPDLPSTRRRAAGPAVSLALHLPSDEADECDTDRPRDGKHDGAPNSLSFAMSSTLLEREPAERRDRRWAPASGALTHASVSLACLIMPA